MGSSSWLVVSNLLLVLVAQAEAEKPLQVRILVEASTAPVAIEQAMTVALVVTARRAGEQPTRLQVVLEAPRALGGRRKVSLDLTDRQEARTHVLFNLPGGPPRVWEIPVRVFAGGRQVLLQDVRLTKAGPWWVIGPFAGGRAESHERVFPPEQVVDVQAVYDGKAGRRIGWQPFPASARHPNGYHDLNQALGPNDNATAYAYAVCQIPESRPARLLIGSDDSIKVWLNGRLVHDHNLHRGAEPGQDVVPVELKSGRNELLLKVVNDDGWWGYFLDIDDGEGKPIAGLQWEVGAAGAPLADPALRLVTVGQTSARLQWRSDEPLPATVHLVEAQEGRRLVWGDTPKEAMIEPAPGAVVRTVEFSALTTRHSVEVTGLRPGTRYLARAEPALRSQSTEKLAFYTAPPVGRIQYLRLPLIAAVFTNATQQKDAARLGAHDPCPPAEIERMQREIDQALRWYWVNTGLRLRLEVDYVLDDRFVATPDDNPYGVGFSPGDEERLQELMARDGKKRGDYDGRLFITFEKVWDEGRQRWFYPASGGGTIGPEYEPGMGKSAWKGGSDNSWLFCHEFGHQLDALYHHSMGPEYLFNHFQPWDDTAHRHGEHWDGNAWLLWEWAGYVTRGHQGRPLLPATKWFRFFTLRWGQRMDAADADSDGVPDDDPRTPLDEKRFGSSPAHQDTDGDGLGDLEEMMASQWVEQGLNERWARGYPHRCDPTRPDSDGDGLADGRDPYPLYPVRPDLVRGGPQPFAILQDEDINAAFALGWDEQFLTLRLSAPQAPEEWRVMLDADDDGWFMGADNYLLRVRPAGGLGTGGEWVANPEGTFAATFHNCGVPGKWPFFDGSRITIADFSFEQQTAAGGYTATLRLARRPANGLDLRPGKRVGVHLAARPQGYARPGMLTAFEPHTFVSIRLAK